MISTCTAHDPSRFIPIRQLQSFGWAPPEKPLCFHGRTSSEALTSRRHAQDYVKLAKWDDRGHAADAAASDAVHRHLHRLQRRSATVLDQPAAGVLADISKAMGLADLDIPELVGPNNMGASSKKYAHRHGPPAVLPEDALPAEQVRWPLNQHKLRPSLYSRCRGVPPLALSLDLQHMYMMSAGPLTYTPLTQEC